MSTRPICNNLQNTNLRRSRTKEIRHRVCITYVNKKVLMLLQVKIQIISDLKSRFKQCF